MQQPHRDPDAKFMHRLSGQVNWAPLRMLSCQACGNNTPAGPLQNGADGAICAAFQLMPKAQSWSGGDIVALQRHGVLGRNTTDTATSIAGPGVFKPINFVRRPDNHNINPGFVCLLGGSS